MNIHSKPPKHLKGYYSRKIGNFYSRHKKPLNTFFLISGTFLLLILVAGFIPYSNSQLSEAVQKLCKKSFAQSCSIRRITIQPWLGVSLDSVSIASDDTKSGFEVTVPTVKVTYHIVPLLFKCIAIKKIMLVDPHVAVHAPRVPKEKEADEKPLSVDALRAQLSSFPFSVVIQSVSVQDGKIDFIQDSKKFCEVSGLDIAMKFRLDTTLSLQGEMSCDQLKWAGVWRVKNLRAKLLIDDFIMTLSKCRADFYDGRINASCKVDLTSLTLERLEFELSRVDLAKLYEAMNIGLGQCRGRLNGKLTMEKSRLVADSLSGWGRAVMTDVHVQNLPLQNNLVVLMAIPQLKDVTFSRFETDLQIKKGKIYTPNIKGNGSPMDVDAQGWVDFDGYFSEQCNGVFERDFIGSLPQIVGQSLNDEPDGRKSFKCRVSGTFKNPRLDVDQRIVNRAVGNVLNEVAKGLGKLFGK